MVDDTSSNQNLNDEIITDESDSNQTSIVPPLQGNSKLKSTKVGKIISTGSSATPADEQSSANLKERELEEQEVSQEQSIHQINLIINEFKAKAEENYDKYIRAVAELENFKKRSLKERSETIKYQGERVFQELLPVIDDFERALNFKESDTQQVIAGIEMIYKRFIEFLDKWEIKRESQVGKAFDPNIHSALAKAPSDKYPEGYISDELKKPIFYKDKLLRPGEVVVSEGSLKPSE